MCVPEHHEPPPCRRDHTVNPPTAPGFTFALQALPHEPPQQGAAVVAERRDLVVVDAELMGHVNAEPL